MGNGDNPDRTAREARRSAERIFNRVFVAWMVTAAVFVALMITGFFLGYGKQDLLETAKGQRTSSLMKALVVLLFFSATIINIGVRWSAKIIAARRFKRADLRPAARAFAVSQLVCFGVYFLFLLAVFYYRVAGAGQRGVLVAATVAAVLASFYFLKIPRYLLSSVFREDKGGLTEDADR